MQTHCLRLWFAPALLAALLISAGCAKQQQRPGPGGSAATSASMLEADGPLEGPCHHGDHNLQAKLGPAFDPLAALRPILAPPTQPGPEPAATASHAADKLDAAPSPSADSGEPTAEPASAHAGRQLPAEPPPQPPAARAEPARAAVLSVPVIALCTEVTGFGTYEPLPPAFAANRRHPTVLYVEVNDFRSQQDPSGRWETRLCFAAELIDAQGRTILRLPESRLLDRSRQRRRDFYISSNLTLPAAAGPGAHALRVTVRDELSGMQAQHEIIIQRLAER